MTFTSSLPTTVEQLTPSWLTAVLRGSGSIGAETAVTAVRTEQIGEGVGFLSYLYRLYLELDGNGPASVVAKLPTDTDYLQLAQLTGAYDREVAFYSVVAPTAPLRTPRAHVASISTGTTNFVLLLEDLGHLDSGDHLSGLTFERAGRVIDELARFHAWGWGLQPEPARHPAFAAIDSPVTTGLYTMGIATGWAIYREHGRAAVPDGLAAVIDDFGTQLPAMVSSLVEPTTLVNGDLRVDNLFFDPQGAPTTVDFQLTMQGAGIWDVAYLVGQGLTPQERGGREGELVQRYVDALAAAGVSYPIDQAWRQFRTATVAQITFPLTAMLSWDTLTERAKDLLHALTERALAIIADTDALTDLPS